MSVLCVDRFVMSIALRTSLKSFNKYKQSSINWALVYKITFGVAKTVYTANYLPDIINYKSIKSTNNPVLVHVCAFNKVYHVYVT